MKTAFTTLTNSLTLGSETVPAMSTTSKQERLIVDALLLLNLFYDGCQNVSSSGKSKAFNTKMEGGVLRVSWTRT